MVRGCQRKLALCGHFTMVLFVALGISSCGEEPSSTQPPTEVVLDADSGDTPDNGVGDVAADVEEDGQDDVEPSDVDDVDAPETLEDVDEDITEDVPEPEECSLDNPCREGECNLNTGECVDKAPCFGALDCVGGEFGDRVCAGCDDGVCPDEGGTCRDRCSTSASCPQEELCIDGGCGQYPALDCLGDGECQGRQFCDSQAFTCVDSPLCEVDEDCRAGRFCDVETNACRTCLRDSDCPGLQRCVEDFLTSFCEEPSVCLSDNDCQGLRFCDGETRRCLNSVCQEDRFEPNNRITENIQFLNEGVITGLRICGGEADLFLVTPPLGQPFVAVSRQSGPIKLSVYPGGADPFGGDAPEPILESTGSADRQGVFLPGVQDSVTYLLHISSPVEGPKNYELRVLFEPPDRVEGPCPEDEANIGPDEALQIQVNDPIGGEVCADEAPGDEDWFSLDLGPNAGLELSLIFSTEGDALEMDFFSLDNGEVVEREVVVESRSFGLVADFPVQEAEETVLVRVSGLIDEARNSFLFSLIAAEVCPDDAEEPNNNTGQSTALSVDPRTSVAVVTDLLVCFDDVDYFGLMVQGGRGLQATVSLNEDVEGAPPSLSVLEEDGEDFTPVGNFSGDQRSTTVTLGSSRDDGGFYLFEVQANVEGVTEYEISVHVFDTEICELNDPLEPSDAQNAVPLETPVVGAYLCAGEDDWYRITADDGQEVDLRITGPPGLLLDLRRLDDNSVLVEGASQRLLTAIDSGGELAIVVRGSDNGVEGDYVLTSNLTADPPGNDSCEGVEVLTNGESVLGTLRGARDSVTNPDPIGCFTLSGSPDVVYSFTLETRQFVDITVVPDDQLQPTVFIQEFCNDPQSALEGLCATDFDDDEPFDGVVTISRRLDAGTYFFWVDGATPGSVGDFEILFEAQ